MLGIRLAVAHTLENHWPISPDALLWSDRFMLETLVGRTFASTDESEENPRQLPSATHGDGHDRRGRRVRHSLLVTVSAARDRKMNSGNAVSKEVTTSGKCR